MYQANPFDLISELLFTNSSAEIPIHGSCMSPVLANGEKVVVKPVEYPLRKGNIYVFIYGTNLYIHRLFKLKNGVAQLIGDRSKTGETIPEQAIIGEPIARNSSFSKILICLVNDITLNLRSKRLSFLRRVRIRIVIGILNIERWLYERKI